MLFPTVLEYGIYSAFIPFHTQSIYYTRLSSFLPSLWSAIRIIAHERRGAIILIALQRLGAISLERNKDYGEPWCNNPYCTPEARRNLNLENLIVEL
jgi:hypothetical protein